MNERFKFRVWDKRRNCYIKSPDPMPLLQANGLLAYFTNNPDAMNYYDIQLCTGLKDKKGKLIYEGDIVDVREKESKRIKQVSKIEYCTKNAAFTCLLYGLFDFRYYANLYDMELEVIGNIYENPEKMTAAK